MVLSFLTKKEFSTSLQFALLTFTALELTGRVDFMASLLVYDGLLEILTSSYS